MIDASHKIDVANLSAELVRWARVADAAYEDPSGPAFAPLLNDLGLRLLETMVATRADAQAFVAELLDEGPPTLVVAFRGTSDLKDFAVDASMNLKTCRFLRGEPRVHCGFLTAYCEVSAQLREAVDRFLGSHVAAGVVVVGHSLGGALATLAAAEVAALWPTRRVVARTFGSPRVGLAAFARAYAERNIDTIRVVHAEDVVPKVPAGWYRHVGGLLHVNADGTVKGAVRGWFRRLLGFESSLFAALDGEGLRDHFILGYVDALKRMTT